MATRALLFAVAALALASLPVLDRCAACDLVTSPWLNAFLRWDGSGYIAIARDGYQSATDFAFFPLYPALIRLTGALFGGTTDAFVIGGILVANIAALAGVWYVAGIARGIGGQRLAATSVLVLLAFPTSFFLSAAYGESLLFLGLAGSAFHAREAKWKRAALLGAIAALARPLGVLAFIPLVLEARHHGRPALAAAAVPIAAAGAWLIAIGGPGRFLAAHALFGRRPALAGSAFADLFDPAIYGDPWIVLGTTVFIGVLTIATWRVLAAPLAALATAYFVAAISSGTLTSAPRYYAAAFPVFICFAMIAGRLGRAVYLVTAMTLGALLVAMFVLWYWVA